MRFARSAGTPDTPGIKSDSAKTWRGGRPPLPSPLPPPPGKQTALRGASRDHARERGHAMTVNVNATTKSSAGEFRGIRSNLQDRTWLN